MSLHSDGRPEPGSPRDTLVDLGWAAVGIAVFGVLAAFEPLFVDLTAPPATAAASVAAGSVVGTALTLASYRSGRARALWRRQRLRFVALFAFIMAMQALLRLAPAPTVLGALAAFVAAAPVRVALYLRYRD